MDQNYNKIYREKKKYTALILLIITLLLIIFVYGDLRGFFGKRGIVGIIVLLISMLYFIWKDELKMRGIAFGFRRSQNANKQQKHTLRAPSNSGIKEYSRVQTPQQTPVEKNQNNSSQLKNSVIERNQMVNNSFLQQQTRYSGQQQDNQVYQRYPQESQLSFSQRQQYDRGFDMRLDSQSTQIQQLNKQEIDKKKISGVRKWGNKAQYEGNGLLGVVSQKRDIPQQVPINSRNREQIRENQNPNRVQQQNLIEKIRNDRDELFEGNLKKQSEFQSIDQLTNAIQKSKIYSFHIIKERASSQLKNILEINKLLFEQFNLILFEAELAQNMIQELENRYDLINSDKRRVTIDDLYNFRNTFQKQKLSIWFLPYDHQINLELINQLIEMIETREQLDSVLEVQGYNFFEIRTHVLTRLFFMYNSQDCDDDQKKQVQDKFPTDIEIVAHCLFLNINEICQQQKDLAPCKIEMFQVHNDSQLIPVQEQHSEKFYFLVCNKIHFEPYYMLQVGKEIIYTLQGPLSFFCALTFYFLHLKNNIFHALSYSECKEILESPAKYILNYEHEYRKGYDRYYI